MTLFPNGFRKGGAPDKRSWKHKRRVRFMRKIVIVAESCVSNASAFEAAAATDQPEGDDHGEANRGDTDAVWR
jgi:hypothetical protein